jgi:integrase
VEETSALNNRVTPYSLRHTGARWMRGHGVSMDDVELQLEHKWPGVTEDYTAFDPAYLKHAAAALNELVLATPC